MIDFKDKSLLITGGTGSFGNTVVRSFLKSDVKEIVIFSRDEKKQEDMRIHFNDRRLKFVLGDVRSFNSIDPACAGIDFIFHAAALKQVPSCEFYPMEAVKTNVQGTENVIKAAKKNGVGRFVLLSTDKAVYPINAMGLSKAMAEKIMSAQARSALKSDTVLAATRYGNVMASRGSVIPLFIEKIKSNKALTLTDPNMTRFLMSLEESVELVMHAFQFGCQGDVFVQKADACTVHDLAIALCELFNVKPNIKIIGTRHGEKLYESLLSREEVVRAIDEGRYYRVPADNRDLNYEKFISSGSPDLNNIEDYTSHNTYRLSIPEIKSRLMSLSYVQEQLK